MPISCPLFKGLKTYRKIRNYHFEQYEVWFYRKTPKSEIEQNPIFSHPSQILFSSYIFQSFDKFNIPKKTKLFVEQSARERETSTVMHRVFQHDLYLLRLNTARSFVRALQTSSNPISSSSGDDSESIKLSAQVLGLGPVFKLIIGLCNTSTSTPSRYLLISFYCDDKMYR